MSIEFDSGYYREPYLTLCREYPDPTIYPQADFRTEWGPIFHRGRLDGTARVLIIGQDPAASEAFARRILVGTAGQRVQGFLQKLGVKRQYVMINTYLYSVYGQAGGNAHSSDPNIAAYRHRWLDALMTDNTIEVVVAMGSLADTAWRKWKATPNGATANPVYAHVKHPTWPDSSSNGNITQLATATKQLLKEWNTALVKLRPAITAPELPGPLIPYGEIFLPQELPTIPDFDLPAGLPPWMRGGTSWAARVGETAKAKRATLQATVPSDLIP
jgi:uracil-DNA glycosylase